MSFLPFQYDTTARNFAIQIPNLLNIVEIYLIGSDYNYHTLYAVESDRVTVWAIGYNGLSILFVCNFRTLCRG
jgi:hypothetical protein